MNATITLPVAYLQAALITAANKDVRYYINGVLIELEAGHARIVSTDGNRMTVLHVKDTYLPDAPKIQIIIPRDALKGIKPANKRAEFCMLIFDPDNLLGECRIGALHGGERVFTPIYGKFPDYKRAMPRKVSGKLGEGQSFNADYLADAKCQAQILGGNLNATFHAEVYPNDGGVAAVLIAHCPEYYGAIMPMRWEKAEFKVPAWLTESAPEPAKLVELRKEGAA